MSASNKYAYLIKNILLFFVASFLPRAITFFMVPLYTYCLTAGEYGTVDLLLTTVQLLIPFITLQTQDAMLRFSMDGTRNQAEVFTIGLRISCIGTLVVLVICFLGHFVGIITLGFKYVLFLVFCCFTNALRNIISYFCKGIDKVKVTTVANVTLSVATVLCSLLFLLVFKWGIYGYMLAICIGNLFAVLILWFGVGLHKYIVRTICDKTLSANIIRFSIPMIFSATAWWINTSLDKYVLNFFYGTAAVGLLSVAYKIPSVLSLFGAAIASAYSISAIKEFDPNDTDGFLGKSYSTINVCFVLMCSGLILVNVFVAKILFSNDFFVAKKFVPPLLFSALMGQLSLLCEQYYIALKKTKIISVTAIVGASLNLVMNLVFIPHYGAYGAAIATAFSFFAVWIIRYCLLKKFLKIKHSFFAECVSYVLLLAQVYLALFENKFILFQGLILFCMTIIYRKEISSLLKIKRKRLR